MGKVIPDLEKVVMENPNAMIRTMLTELRDTSDEMVNLFKSAVSLTDPDDSIDDLASMYLTARDHVYNVVRILCIMEDNNLTISK